MGMTHCFGCTEAGFLGFPDLLSVEPQALNQLFIWTSKQSVLWLRLVMASLFFIHYRAAEATCNKSTQTTIVCCENKMKERWFFVLKQLLVQKVMVAPKTRVAITVFFYPAIFLLLSYLQVWQSWNFGWLLGWAMDLHVSLANYSLSNFEGVVVLRKWECIPT